MILIFSQSSLESSTEEVMDWLEALGARCLRLNGDDIEGRAALRFQVEDGTLTLGVEADGIELPLAEVGAVWFRRWLFERRHETVDLLPPTAENHRLHYELKRHLNLESRRLSDLLFSSFGHLPWLSHPRRSSLNKLDALRRAARAGLATPATLVTTERDALRRFCEEQGGTVITKPIGEVDAFVEGEVSHFLYTTPLDLPEIDALPERFAPSLFQERIEKAYELRVFYLDGGLHAMAIFSQDDPQTRADFRQYNHERPNRTVPYRLTSDLEERLRRLMVDLELETGSIDLLVTRDGRAVFLEVNPVGQFGMVSHACNYPLERGIAELLIRKAEHGGRP